MTTNGDCNQHMDEASGCFSWDFSSSDKTFLVFLLGFLSCVIFSSTANGFLFFLTVRHKQLLWQPQYILINNISVSGIGMSLVTALVVLSSIVRKQTQVYGHWCIAQFCILRCFFLTSHMTLAVMAIERYIFICHGIHYLRIITTYSISIVTGLIWLVSGALSLHGGLVLSWIECGFQQQTNGLLCDAFTIKELIPFSYEQNMLVFGPPSVLTAFCVLVICYSYGCIYHAALRVSIALKCNNHRAKRTVGFYFLMFLLQLALNIFFIVLTMTGKKEASSCRSVNSLVTPLIIIIPTFIIGAFLLVRNPQIRQLLFSLCQSTWHEAPEVFDQSSRADGIGEDASRQEEKENKETPSFSLPG